jgi:hypothetical protein
VVRRQVKLECTNKDGVSLGDQLESISKQTGMPLEELYRKHDVGPIAPLPGGEVLLNTFFEMSAGRQSTEAGPASLSWVDMSSYLQLMDERLDPWEVRALRQLDNTFLTELYKLRSET